MPEDMLLQLESPFRVWGEANARAVLALHCSLAHAGAWSGVARRLPDVQVTSFDQPSHGRAAGWDGVSDLHDLTTRIALGFAERMAVDGPIDLLGHSFGATVALRIAMERPDLVRSLVLVEPVIFAAARAAGAPEFAPFAQSHLGLAPLVAEGRTAEAAAAFHAVWGGDVGFSEMPEMQQRYMSDRIHLIVAQNPILLEDSAGLLGSMRLESIGVPVLLIEGGASPPIIGAVQAELARRLAAAERLVVPGAGHMVPITHPDMVAGAICEFLAQC
jgi:lipase